MWPGSEIPGLKLDGSKPDLRHVLVIVFDMVGISACCVEAGSSVQRCISDNDRRPGDDLPITNRPINVTVRHVSEKRSAHRDMTMQILHQINQPVKGLIKPDCLLADVGNVRKDHITKIIRTARFNPFDVDIVKRSAQPMDQVHNFLV